MAKKETQKWFSWTKFEVDVIPSDKYETSRADMPFIHLH